MRFQLIYGLALAVAALVAIQFPPDDWPRGGKLQLA